MNVNNSGHCPFEQVSVYLFKLEENSDDEENRVIVVMFSE